MSGKHLKAVGYPATVLALAAYLSAGRAFADGTLNIYPGNSASLTGSNLSNFLLNNSGLVFTMAAPNANANFNGTFNNYGLFSLVHPLTLTGSMTLNGTGTMTLDGGTLTASGTQRFVNNSLIIGSGAIGNGSSLKFTNNGTLVAATNTLTLLAINGAADGFVNNGLVLANGGQVVLAAGTYSNSFGIIEAASSSVVQMLSPIFLTGGTLRSDAGGSMVLAGNISNVQMNGNGFTSTGATFTGASTLQGSLSIPSGIVMFNGTLSSSGSIQLGAAELRIAGNSNWAGGSVELKGASQLTMSAPNVMLTSSSFIFGQGQLSLTLTNTGTISATTGPLLLGGSVTNTGAVIANGGTLIIAGNVINTNGTVQAFGGSKVIVNPGTITGGSIRAAAGGVVQLSAGSLSNITFDTPAGGSLSLSNVVLNNVVLNVTASNIAITGSPSISGVINNQIAWTLPSPLHLNGNMSLNGAGTLALANFISTGGLYTFTNNSTIVSGALGGGTPLRIINNGTLMAASTVLSLDLKPQNATDGFLNLGLLQANGGTLVLEHSTFTNSGHLIECLANSTVFIHNAATIIGGTLRNTQLGSFTVENATLSNLALDGHFSLGSAMLTGTVTNGGIVSGDFSLNGTVQNAGSLTGISWITLSGNSALTGGGTFLMNDSLLNDNAHGWTFSNSNVIAGTGSISTTRFVNTGTLSAVNGFLSLSTSASGTDSIVNGGTLLATGGTLSIYAGTLNNAGGLILASAGAEIDILTQNATIVGGTVRADASTIVLNSVLLISPQSVEALHGGIITAASGGYFGSVRGGTVTATDGSSVILGGFGFSGVTTTLQADSTSTMRLVSGYLANVINNADLTLIPGGPPMPTNFILQGSISNNKSITMITTASDHSTFFSVTADFTLSGSGAFLFNRSGGPVPLISISNSQTLSTFSSTNAISGSLDINGGSLTRLINSGTISATLSPGINVIFTNATPIPLNNPFNIINKGTFRADGTSLTLSAARGIDNTTGLIDILPGGTLLLGGTLTGGTLALATGATIKAASNVGDLPPVLDNITLAGSGGLPSLKMTGSLTVAGNFALPANASTANATALPSLYFASDTSSHYLGKLDIATNKLVLATSSPANKTLMLPVLQSALTSGFHNGDWLGQGITSSTVAADQSATGFHMTALALYDNANLHLGSFGGQSVDSSSLLITTAIIGDTNLDGVVNSTDFAAVVNHWQSAEQDWTTGDVNNDGFVDLLDAVLVASHMGQSGGAAKPAVIFAVAAGNGGLPVLTVPEPGSLGLLMLVAPAFFWRMRGRSTKTS